MDHAPLGPFSPKFLSMWQHLPPPQLKRLLARYDNISTSVFAVPNIAIFWTNIPHMWPRAATVDLNYQLARLRSNFDHQAHQRSKVALWCLWYPKAFGRWQTYCTPNKTADSPCPTLGCTSHLPPFHGGRS